MLKLLCFFNKWAIYSNGNMYLSEYILDLQISAYITYCIFFLLLATFCGLSSIVVKVLEYVHEILEISKISQNSLMSSRKI